MGGFSSGLEVGGCNELVLTGDVIICRILETAFATVQKPTNTLPDFILIWYL